MKLKKGDTVLVIAGKDRGRAAKIIKSIPKEGRILVEGINLKSRHVRPKRQGEKGQVVKLPASFSASNVKFICPQCGKASRLGYTIAGGKKSRFCKKCNAEV